MATTISKISSLVGRSNDRFSVSTDKYTSKEINPKSTGTAFLPQQQSMVMVLPMKTE